MGAAKTLSRPVRASARRASLAVVALAVVATGLAVPGVAVADTAGPAYAGSGANVTLTGRAWSNPGNITAFDGNNAVTAQLNSGRPISDYLRGYDFGLHVPAGATITGIQVDVMRRGSAENSVADNIVQLSKDGAALIGTNKATNSAWPATMTLVTYGGPTDLWGASWTPADINDDAFSVMLSARRTAGSITASVDYVRITVTYDPPPLTYTLTYTAGTGGTISGTSPQTVAYGGSGTPVMAVADPGYQFTSWSDGVTTATRTDTNVTADISVTANFAINTYTVTFEDWDGSVLKTEAVAYGGSATAPADPTRTGYTFAGWSDDFSSITADLTVTALYDINTHTLTYTAGTGGTIDGTSPQTVAYGGSGTPVTAIPNSGYTFVKWSDDVMTATRTDTNVMADLSVTALFAPDVPTTYTLTYTAGTGGTISGTSPQTVAHGGSGTPVMAVADPGYQFTSWSDGVTTATRTDTNVTANLSVTANFTPDAPTYPLVYPFDGGQVVFTQVTSAGGITVTRLAPRHPDPVGYRLLDSSYQEITVNHTFSGSATVSIEYQTSELSGAPESGLRMFRWTGTSWQQLPSTVDTASKVVSGTTTQFSDFAVAAPTSTEPPVVLTPASSTWSLVVLALLGIALVFAARLRRGDSRA